MKSYHDMVKRYLRKEQKEYYEYEANRSALLWAGLMLLLSLWLYAEYKHMERQEQRQEQRTEQVQ